MFKVGRALATIAVASMVMLTAVDLAEARRAGGGFGSRGTRTFSTPPITRTAPGDAAPINRTMTPQQTPGQATGQQTMGQTRPAAQRPGLFGGFLGLLLQVGLIFGAVMLAMRFFGRRNEPAAAGYSPRDAATGYSRPSGNGFDTGMPFKIPQIGGAARQEPARAASQPADEIGVGQQDLDQFETMLKQVQAAYATEDYAALRKLTTPEAMSWLAEELSDNATKGLKNEVSDVHLVQGDVAEAWREDDADYATVAMRYESIDVTRDRATGRVVEGDPDHPTEAVELWTFLRKRGGDWQVSAIQGMAA